MALVSKLFSGDPRLEACLVSDPAHVTPGSVGDFVGKIQQALIVMGLGVISADEIAAQRYGNTTAAAVLEYKRERKIINFSYQKTADNIVGKMTIAKLDEEMAAFEKKNQPPPPPPTPVEVEPVSTRFSVRAALAVGGLLVMEEPPDGSNVTKITDGSVPQCYQVFDVVNNRNALYLFDAPGTLQIRIDSKFYNRTPRQFSVPFPLPLSGLKCKCVYATRVDSEGRAAAVST